MSPVPRIARIANHFRLEEGLVMGKVLTDLGVVEERKAAPE
jgi:hypothetical protein